MSSTARGKLDKWNRNSSSVKSLTKIAILLDFIFYKLLHVKYVESYLYDLKLNLNDEFYYIKDKFP